MSELAFLLENAAWPAFLLESDGTIRRANRAASDCFGLEVDSGSCHLAAIWSEDNDLPLPEFLSQLDQTGGTVITVRLRGSGKTAGSHAAAICRSNQPGEKSFVVQLLPAVGCGEDKDPAGDTSLAYKQKLDCALQLARSVALDFNNALTGILGHASLILSKADPDYAFRDSLVEMEKAVDKAAEIAQQLTAFSRPEKEQTSTASGNLNTLLRRLVDTFQRTSNGATKWSIQLERCLYFAKFDEAKVHQAIGKILENAVEAVNNSGHITVTTRNLEISQATQDRAARLEPGYYVCVEITDDGNGIESEALPKIFEPFFTTKQGHRGLGLAWVYGIITNHGGAVAASSQPGQGTSIRVYLPSSEKFVTEGDVRNDDLNGQGTILMVDDEPLILTMGQTVLSAYGYRVLTADTGAKALEMVGASKTMEPVRLMITDLVMPQMSGRELIAEVRKISPLLPIICMSGYGRPASEENRDFHLQKPFTSQELLRHVKQVLCSCE